MEEEALLPLGTVVELKDASERVMIIARGIAYPHNGGLEVYEYGACLFPEGLIDDKTVLFDSDAIQRVVFMGFTDADSRKKADEVFKRIASLKPEQEVR